MFFTALLGNIFEWWTFFFLLVPELTPASATETVN
jgi:hypothetical protein